MNLNKILANFNIADVTVWKCLNISKHSEPLVSETSARFGLAWDEIIVLDGQSAPHTSLLQTDLNTVCVFASEASSDSLSTSRSTHTLDLRATRGLGCLHIVYWLDFQTWGTHWCLIRAVVRNIPNRNVVRHKVSCAIVSPTRKQHYFCFWSTSGIRPVQA